MKRVLMTGLIAGAVLAGVKVTEAAGQKSHQPEEVLNKKLSAKMDANHDGKVSKKEYIDFGTTCMQKKGKKADSELMECTFSRFDRDGDGFITDSDPTYKSPREVLMDKIMGGWVSANNSNPLSFIFMENGLVDVIQRGESLRKKAHGNMSYKFTCPKRPDLCLAITMNKNTSAAYYIKCVVKIVNENQIKMRVVSGGPGTPQPKKFREGHDPDTIILSRNNELLQKHPIKVAKKKREGVTTLFGKAFEDWPKKKKSKR